MTTKIDTLRNEFNNQRSVKFGLSLAVDFVGILTYLLPAFGELFDLGWAPVAALANWVINRGFVGFGGGGLTLVEELAPGTDIIPSVTLTWLVKYVLRRDSTFSQYAKSRNVTGGGR